MYQYVLEAPNECKWYSLMHIDVYAYTYIRTYVLTYMDGWGGWCEQILSTIRLLYFGDFCSNQEIKRNYTKFKFAGKAILCYSMLLIVNLVVSVDYVEIKSVCVCVRACVRACVRVCVLGCVCGTTL